MTILAHQHTFNILVDITGAQAIAQVNQLRREGWQSITCHPVNGGFNIRAIKSDPMSELSILSQSFKRQIKIGGIL